MRSRCVKTCAQRVSAAKSEDGEGEMNGNHQATVITGKTRNAETRADVSHVCFNVSCEFS